MVYFEFGRYSMTKTSYSEMLMSLAALQQIIVHFKAVIRNCYMNMKNNRKKCKNWVSPVRNGLSCLGLGILDMIF